MRQLRGINIGAFGCQMLAIIGNYCCITNSPLLRHIIAKIIYKIILYISNLSVFLPNAAIAGMQYHKERATIAGLQEHGG